MAVRLTTPVTIVTGSLGSGKTTLVNRFLREPHGARIAVIENELGAVGVDAEFLSQTGEETIIQLENGCLCCNVRGDLANALQELVQRAQARGLNFDRVLIETTGLADPGPVIQTFLAETAIEAWYHLDGVVTVVDAAHATQQTERTEFQHQLGYADRIVVSKTDLLAPDALAEVRALLAGINPRAPVLEADLNTGPVRQLVDHVFDTRGFANDYVPAEELRQALTHLRPLTEGDGKWRPVGAGRHTADVRACVYVSDAPLELDLLNAAIDALVGHYGPRLWRCKGIVHALNHRSRLVVQGVQGLVQINGGMMWRPFEARRTVLVFIGQGLETVHIQRTLGLCEVPGERAGSAQKAVA